MAFEEFHGNRARRDIPIVSLLNTGDIALNNACVTEYFKSYMDVILMFDRATHRIGLKPTNEARANGRKIARRKGGRAQISAKSFLKSLGFPIGKTKKYTCRWNEEEELLEVQLEKLDIKQ